MPGGDAAGRDELRDAAALIADVAARALDVLIGIGAAAPAADGSGFDPYRNAPTGPQDALRAYQSDAPPDAQPASWPNSNNASVPGWHDETGRSRGDTALDVQQVSWPTSGSLPLPGSDSSRLLGEQELHDADGNYIGTKYVYADGTTYTTSFRGDMPSVDFGNSEPVDIKGTLLPSAPASPQPAPIPAETMPQQDLPPLPPPDMAPADASPGGPVQTAAETIIVGETPFSPPNSNPDALRAAEGRGRFEAGDAEQFFRGAYNGLLDLAAMLPMFAPVIAATEPPKAEIDPRYGGAAIVGEQLSQNLALEAMAALPMLGRGGARALSEMPTLGQELGSGLPELIDTPLPVGADQVTVEKLTKTPVLPFIPGARYQIRSTGSGFEQVFRITRDGEQSLVFADHFNGDFIVEAKESNFHSLDDPKLLEHESINKYATRIHNQASNYLLISDKLGLRGVRYAVSDLKGVEILERNFKLAFPEAMASGQLSVWYVP